MPTDNTHKAGTLKVLSLEDSARDFELIKEQLVDAGYALSIEWAETEDAYTNALRNSAWDLILADFRLPGFDAFSALRIRNEICPDTPFICVSGSIGEETAIELLKAGAVDYVIKDRPDRLPFAVERALNEARERTIRLQTDAALKESYRQLQQSQRKLEQTVIGVIDLISRTVEARDQYTAGHEHMVAILAGAIAEEMGLSADIIKGLTLAAGIHDLGKIAVPAEILSKPGKLNDLEFELVKMHPQTGYDILKHIEFPWRIAEMVYQHHERLDGSGYPRGLKGDDILLEARIISVADVVEAMMSHRPYRPSLGIDRALEEIESNKGLLYDTDVVDACLRLTREKGFQLVN